MKSIEGHWEAAVRRRLGAREEVPHDLSFDRLFAALGLPREGVTDCLQLIESEFGIPAGLLRPGDKIRDIITPPRKTEPWRWLVLSAREDDGVLEIQYRLAQRLRRARAQVNWGEIVTLEDLLRTWCAERQ